MLRQQLLTTFRVFEYDGTNSGVSFTIQASGAPLAIKLHDITALNVGNRNRIDWHTASEDDGDYFILERSADGSNFTALSDEILAKGGAATYSHWDQTPINGINHYRLRMMDATGRATLSKVVTATVKGKTGFSVEAFPNPVSDIVTVKIYGTQGNNPSIVITDVTGKIVSRATLTGNTVEVNMSNLSSGIYLIKYTDATHAETIKVNKQ